MDIVKTFQRTSGAQMESLLLEGFWFILNPLVMETVHAELRGRVECHIFDICFAFSQ